MKEYYAGSNIVFVVKEIHNVGLIMRNVCSLANETWTEKIWAKFREAAANQWTLHGDNLEKSLYSHDKFYIPYGKGQYPHIHMLWNPSGQIFSRFRALDWLMQPALLDSTTSSCCCTFSSNFCVSMAGQLCSNPWRKSFVEGKIWDHPSKMTQKLSKLGGGVHCMVQ